MSNIINLNEFNLTLGSLKNIKNNIHVRIFFKGVSIQTLKKYPRRERRAKDQEQRQRVFKRMSADCTEHYTVIGSKQDPQGIETRVNASMLLQLTKDKHVRALFIEQVKGRKKRPVTTTKKLSTYCAKLHLVVQVEGQKKGMQTHEYRYILVNAKSEKEAMKKVMKEKKPYEQVYMNEDYALVRWKLLNIEDVVEVFDDKNGVAEVYSELFYKRVTEKTVWV